jgi:RNA polymerase sigma-70 factor (ECF subfamily)
VTDEHLLIERAKQGDVQAFRELVERSKRIVYRLAYDMTGNRHDAEDLSQDVFVKAYRSLPGFRGDAKWNTWLHRITVNTCLDHRKSSAPQSMEFNDDTEHNTPGDMLQHRHETILPDRAAQSTMIQQHIQQALDCLTPRQRSVFVLRHYHDLPMKQIAETLEVAEGTVKTLLFRAVQRLREELSFYKKDLGMEKQP